MALPVKDATLWNWMLPNLRKSSDLITWQKQIQIFLRRVKMNYDKIFQERLEKLKQEGNYRVFADLERYKDLFPAKNYIWKQGT